MKKVGSTSVLTKFFEAVPGKRLFGIYRQGYILFT